MAIESYRNASFCSDLRLLAVSAQITEIFYSLSDLQTRIFGERFPRHSNTSFCPILTTWPHPLFIFLEIQELRHRSLEPSSSKTTTDERTSSESTRSSTSVIDNALGQLDVRLDVVAQSVASVTTTLEPVLNNMKTPTDNQDTRARDAEEEAVITRKYGDLLREWDSVKGDATTLREELKEDKWLAVFRTVSEQAEGMMGSLTKAVNMCQVGDAILPSKRGLGLMAFDAIGFCASSASNASAKQAFSRWSARLVVRGGEGTIAAQSWCLRRPHQVFRSKKEVSATTTACLS